MIKNILAVAVVVALGACSSGSNNSGTTDNGVNNDGPNNGPNNGNNNNVGNVVSPGGGLGPVTESSAGSYTGTIGSSTGVFLINNDFDLAGLAINANGSALSVFGNVGSQSAFSGNLRQYIHQESLSANASISGAAGSFGAVGGAGNDLSVNVNIVNGQSIESTADSAVAVMLLGTEGSSVSPANAQTMAGSWQGVHSFCGGDTSSCSLLTTSLTFAGTTVTGSTVITNVDGSVDPAIEINGSITEFGDAALIDFTWGDAALYSGVAFFKPGDPTSLVFIGENAANSAPTIAAVMSAQ